MRDFLGAPTESSDEPRGYGYTDAACELPGVWFTAEELQGLLTLQQLLATENARPLPALCSGRALQGKAFFSCRQRRGRPRRRGGAGRRKAHF